MSKPKDEGLETFLSTIKGAPPPLTEADGRALAAVPNDRWFSLRDIPHTVKNPYWRMQRLHKRGALAWRFTGTHPHLVSEWFQGIDHTPLRTVVIPACQDHEGKLSRTVTLVWRCLTCGKVRGEPFDSHSFDGSRRLACHAWTNPCGHTESYAMIREALDENP